MKYDKNSLIQLAILAGLGMAVVLSLVIPQQLEPDRNQEPPEISVIIREPDGSSWLSFRQGMEHAAGDIGADLRFLSLSRENDGAEQEELIRREAEGGTDIFVISAADPENLEQKLPELTDRCPTVALESSMSTAGDQVVLDNTAMGEDMARDLIQNWAGGSVVLINSAPACTAVTQRLNGARSILTGRGIPVEERQCSASELEKQLPRMLSQTAARYVMVFEHTATEQAARARENGGVTSQIWGVGAGPSLVACLERGLIHSVAAWSDYAEGYLSVARALSLWEGTYTWQERDVDYLIVHREDIYDPEIQKILFPVAP